MDNPNIEWIAFLALDKQLHRVIPGTLGELQGRSSANNFWGQRGCSYHLWPSSNYLCSRDRDQRWSLSVAEDQQTKLPATGWWLSRRGTAASWRVQSAWFSRRASCIMHGGCYFHHMVLSGVIVVPAPSAQIALCSQIVVLGAYFNPLTPFTPPSIPSLSPRCLLEMAWEDPVGSINWPCLQSGLDPGLKEESLAPYSEPLVVTKLHGESGPALESMHYFTQQVTTEHADTNASRRSGVSKEVCLCTRPCLRAAAAAAILSQQHTAPSSAK